MRHKDVSLLTFYKHLQSISIFFPNLLTRKARKFSLNEMSQQRCVLLDGIGHTYTKNYFVNHTALQFDEHNYRCPLEFRGNMHPNHQL